MRTDRWVWTVGAAALLLVACEAGGGGSGSNSGTDTTAGQDTGLPMSDGGTVTGDAGPTTVADGTVASNDLGPTHTNNDTTTTPPPTQDGGTGVVEPPVMDGCDQTGFSAANEIAVIQQDPGNPNKYLMYQAHSSAQPPVDLISVEINAGMAPAPGTTVDLAGMASADLSQGVPVLVAMATACTQQGCSKVLLADAGTISFQELNETGKIVATLVGVRLIEAQINQQTGQASPVAGGTSWCLPLWEIDMPFDQPAELPSGGPAQASCVASGTGVYEGDNVADLTLTNCLGEPVSLHATCGQSKAHWLIGTAGWCTACDQLIAGIKGQFDGPDGVMSRASIAAAQPGLDVWLVLGEDTNSAAPTQAYCVGYANQKGVDPAMVVMDNANPAKEIPLVDPQGYALPANALGNTWEVINPYLTADASGQVQMGFPWSGVLRGSNMEYVWSDYMGGDINQVLSNLLSQ